MKKRISRFIAVFMAVVVAAVTLMPQLPVYAAEAYQESYVYDLEQMKQKLLENEDTQSSGKSAATFPGSAAAVNVGTELVYHIFRQGNADKKQTATVVTQDFTAGYGKDYEIVVDGKVIEGKANPTMDGAGVTYDVYLEDKAYSSGDSGDLTSDADKDKQIVDMEQVRENASCTFDVTFEPGKQVKEIRIRAPKPKKAVGNKTFQMVICEDSDRLCAGSYQSSVITIAETRKTKEAEVKLIKGSAQVADGYITVMVKRTGNTSGYTSYRLESEDGTAVNGEDFVLDSRELFFTPGVARQRIHIPLVSAEELEKKTFTLSAGESSEKINYTTTLQGAATTFKKTRGTIDISMHEFVTGDYTGAVDGISFDWEDNYQRYKFGFHSKMFKGNERNGSIRTKEKYDFTGVKKVKFSASYAVGTVVGDNLDVYVSNEDYAKSEAKLGNLKSMGARYGTNQLLGQGMHEFEVDRTGELYLYMTAEQHAGSGWIYYYLYDQDFDGGDKGHVALELEEYSLEIRNPNAINNGVPISDVRLALTTDSSISGEKISQAYRDECYQISFTQLDESAKYVGYQLENTSGNVICETKTEKRVFELSSDIIAKYGDKFTDNKIIIRPIMEHEEAEVKILAQDFDKMGADNLSVDIDQKSGKAVYKEGIEEIATVTWDAKQYIKNSTLTFTVTENSSYAGDYHLAAFKESWAANSKGAMSNPVYHSVSDNKWSVRLEKGYYEITPIVSNRQSKLLLNVKGASHGNFDGKSKNQSGDECTVTSYDGKYDANDIVIFNAKPDSGYRAKWSYRDVASGKTKTYYGQRFYYRVQVPMLMTDNYVSLEFEKTPAKKNYKITTDVYMQGGDLMHEPAADSDVYSPLAGASVSLETISKKTDDNGTAGIFSIEGVSGEAYTALVTANNRQYIQEVKLPDSNEESVCQSMKLSYYYEGPRVTSMQYYAADGSVQNGDVIYLKNETDSVVLAAGIETAGQQVTDVIYRLKSADGSIKQDDGIAERNGSQYIWSAPLGMIAEEGDQIWIELVNQKTDSKGNVISRISYGEVNTGYSIVKADYIDDSETAYLPDVGLDQEISNVPFFGNFYFLFGVSHVKMPSFTISASGGVTYITMGISSGMGRNFAQKDSKFASPNTLTAYVKQVKTGMEVIGNSIKNRKDLAGTNKYARQSLTKVSVSFNFAISAQIAIYNMQDKETKLSHWEVVGSWLTAGVSGVFSFNIPFVVYGVPLFFCMTFTLSASDTFQIYSTDPCGYVPLEAMHDPKSSAFRPDNDFKVDFPVAASVGVGVNGVVDVAGGVTGKIMATWSNWEWGTVKMNLTGDLKIEFLVFGFSHSWNLAQYTILDTNPYKTQQSVQNEQAQNLMNEKLSGFKMKSFDSYNQKVTGNSGSGRLISDAYEFSKPKLYSIGNNKYMIIASVDKSLTGEGSKDSDDAGRAVMAYAIYDAGTGKYETASDGSVFTSLEPELENENSINFHPSVTAVKDGRYLISWNSILRKNADDRLSLTNARTVVKAAVYNSKTDKIEAYKSLVTEDSESRLMSSLVLDTAYDAANNEVVVLYRALNLNGLDKNSTISDYVSAGSKLLCTSINLDRGKASTFTESVPIASGGQKDGKYNVIKSADLEIMDGRPVVAYQMTKGSGANLLSTAEEGSTNHIYLAGLTHSSDGGYTIWKTKEVTADENSQYNAQPQLLSYEAGGKAYNILMWRNSSGMETLEPMMFLNNAEEDSQSIRVADISDEKAGAMGDYQIIKGLDGKVYSIWTEAGADGSKVMMAALDDTGSSVGFGTGSPVLEIPEGSYISEMSPAVDRSGRLHLLYRSTEAGDDGKSEILLKEADLTKEQLVVKNYTGLTDEELQKYEKAAALTNMGLHVSNLLPTAGETLTISGRIKNAGVTASKERKLQLYVNGSKTNQTVTVPAMNAGMEDEFTFTYTVPDDFDGSPIKFAVKGDNGTQLTQSTSNGASLDVTDVKFEQLTYPDEQSDTVSYNVRASVYNSGNDISQTSTLVMSHVVYGKENGEEVAIEDKYGSCDVPAVKPGEAKRVTFKLDIPKKYFEENQLMLAPVTGTIYYDYNPDNIENQSIASVFNDYIKAEEQPEAESLQVSKTRTLGVGQSLSVRAKVLPVAAKEFAGLTYSSSDTSVARIDSNGILTGVSKGTCTVKITTKNGLKRTVKIKVTKHKVREDDNEEASAGINKNTAATAMKHSFAADMGVAVSANALAQPDKAQVKPDNKDKTSAYQDGDSDNTAAKTGTEGMGLMLILLAVIAAGAIFAALYRKRKKE